MNFKEYVLTLDDVKLEQYAKEAGTTVSYLKSHLLYAYKEPRKKLRVALAKASQGKVSELEVLYHFGLYPSCNNSIDKYKDFI